MSARVCLRTWLPAKSSSLHATGTESNWRTSTAPLPAPVRPQLLPERFWPTTEPVRGLMTEADARAMLERIRWPEGVRCIYEDCGGADVYRIETKGKTYTRPDGSERTVPARHLFKCKACKRQFSVTKGTIFEDSKISLVT